jgi:hypothetical protein
MRMLTVVGLGVVLLGMAGAARVQGAADAPPGFYGCSDQCDRDYDACRRRSTGKSVEDCAGNVIKCRDKCSPQWREIKHEAAKPLSCRDKCQASFDSCTHAYNGKQGGSCQRDFMVCRDACPPEQPPEAAAQSAPPPAPVAAPAAAPPPEVAAPVAVAAPPPAAAPPAAAPPPAPEKASAPAPAIDKRQAAPNPVPPARAAAAPAIAAVPENNGGPTSTQPATAQGTTRAAEPKRTAWERIYCTMFYCGTGATAQKPMSCEDKCVADYDDCIAHADPKRGTDQCSSGSLRCRKGCAKGT